MHNAAILPSQPRTHRCTTAAARGHDSGRPLHPRGSSIRPSISRLHAAKLFGDVDGIAYDGLVNQATRRVHIATEANRTASSDRCVDRCLDEGSFIPVGANLLRSAGLAIAPRERRPKHELDRIVPRTWGCPGGSLGDGLAGLHDLVGQGPIALEGPTAACLRIEQSRWSGHQMTHETAPPTDVMCPGAYVQPAGRRNGGHTRWRRLATYWPSPALSN
mmetsp:Transcript_7844/g.15976  ORF Transcript_7844/g.15976 Transcript_7844/m.15976 type:complete len:218 (-) Transcript_7844:326-979(-)